MKKTYLLFSLLFALIGIVLSCSKTEEEYVIVPVVKSEMPYAKLSDYGFFTGTLKNFMPATNVLPYEPASSLFADFAHKKRFLYMPQGTKATYNGDGNVLEYPVGAVLIKSFY